MHRAAIKGFGCRSRTCRNDADGRPFPAPSAMGEGCNEAFVVSWSCRCWLWSAAMHRTGCAKGEVQALDKSSKNYLKRGFD